MKVLVVTPESKVKMIKLGDDKLHEMQQLVGGYVENVYPAHVRLPEQFSMVVNEEGHIHNLPINPIASRIYGGPIAGTAVFVRVDKINKTGEMDWVDCTEEQMDKMQRLIGSLGAVLEIVIMC